MPSTRANKARKLRSFGAASLSASGQISVPVELLRALQLEDTKATLFAFGDIERRELIFVVEPAADALYAALATANQSAAP